jgi:proteasome assembly chaperone (PAC2) family protein
VIELADVPELTDPVMIAAFEGWNDAGEAATSAVEHLARVWKAEPFAALDPEDYYDFQVNRPTVGLDSDGRRRVTWPTTRLLAARVPSLGRDVVIVDGIEPSMRWRGYAVELLQCADRLGVTALITVGALLADVPHTRPIPITSTSDDPTMLEDLDVEQSRYEGPTGIVGVLHDAWRRAGLRSASLWATVPAYVPGAPSPKAALALIERTSAMLQTWVPTTDLEIAASSYERQVSELVDADEETASYVAGLEERHDAEGGTVPSAETIAEEVERFLREQ